MEGIAEKSDDKKQKICFCYVTIRGLFLGFYIHIFPDECQWAQRCLTPLRPLRQEKSSTPKQRMLLFFKMVLHR